MKIAQAEDLLHGVGGPAGRAAGQLLGQHQPPAWPQRPGGAVDQGPVLLIRETVDDTHLAVVQVY